MHASLSAMKCNLAPIRLGLRGGSADLRLQNDGKRMRDADGVRRVGVGGGGGARSLKLTARLNNVIKHGRALGRCIIPDLHSRQEVGREERKRGRRQMGGVMVSREKNFRERGHTIGRMRPEKKKKNKAGQG